MSKKPFESPYVEKIRNETNSGLAELRSQNERLRLQLAGVESDRNRMQQEKLRLQEQLMTFREELSQRVDEHNALLRRLAEVEHENDVVSSRFLDIETHNTNLANLYVAGFQLHGSLDRDMVMASIKEIVINLIGSEDFGIFERAGDDDRLDLIGWFDDPPSGLETVRFGEGIVGQVAASGEPYMADGHRALGVRVCIPLKVDDHVTGAIAIFSLLPQKHDTLEDLDHELLSLLSNQAGVALYCTRLHEEKQLNRAMVGA